MAGQSRSPAANSTSAIADWFAARPHLTLSLGVLVALGLFINKPINADDPLFIWVGRQIQAHPLNPYGFDVNWYGQMSPMWEVTRNPPLASYYLAVWAAILGWSEVALHCAMLLPAAAVILGTFQLARHFTAMPFLAAALTLFTPVFLVSSMSLMCDTLMLAFWVWAIVLWQEGVSRNNLRRTAVAAILAALAGLTKYFGACLIPLLAAYACIARFRHDEPAIDASANSPRAVRSAALLPHLLLLIIPMAVLGAYEWFTHHLYGKALLFDAGRYAATTRVLSVAGMADLLTAMAFTGGCFAVATFLTLFLWRPRILIVLAAPLILLAAWLLSGDRLLKPYNDLTGTSTGLLGIQIVFWAVGAAGLLALALANAWSRRDAGSITLMLWVWGTFVFTAFFNWTVNARSLLPMAPAIGILVASRVAAEVTRLNPHLTRKGESESPRVGFHFLGLRPMILVCIIAGVAIALMIARADFLLAKASRQSAATVHAKYAGDTSTLWYEGHWGFQYYMEQSGPKAQEVIAQHSFPKLGDWLAIPMNNANTDPPDARFWHPHELLPIDGPRWWTTTSKQVGAGFHAAVWGPLPFAFGKVPPETVLIFKLGPPPGGNGR